MTPQMVSPTQIFLPKFSLISKLSISMWKSNKYPKSHTHQTLNSQSPPDLYSLFLPNPHFIFSVSKNKTLEVIIHPHHSLIFYNTFVKR